MPDFEPMLNEEQVARSLGVTVAHLHKLCREGKIPARKLGRFWRFLGSQLAEWQHGEAAKGAKGRAN